MRRLPADIQRRAWMRLQRMVAATVLTDIRVPQSHRLATLRGDHAGQHSVRINNQRWVCFVWTDQGAMEIEVVDYHLRRNHHNERSRTYPPGRASCGVPR